MRERVARMGSAVVVLAVVVLAVVVFLAFAFAFAGPAAADTTGRYALEMSGERYGLVVLKPAPAQLVVSTQEVPRPLVTLLTGFASGKPVKRDVRLSSGAIIRKTKDARLVAVHLPQLGAGGAPEVELAFTAAPLTTQPLLSVSAKESAPPPASARITTFRIEVASIPTVAAPKLDAITLTQKPDGTVTTGVVGFEAGAGGAPPFAAWQKANGGHPAPRTVKIEYVAADGAAILELQLERCMPTEVVPQGANGTTRIAMTCGGVRAR